ncbi:hypothetical protein, partial [Neisseria sp. Marseille-Q2251]|uniref:hypothetical protein n=1 Tax=Neisseria sp. Marseille-Q2251 TaxID=2866585 RepID=UPI003139DD04
MPNPFKLNPPCLCRVLLRRRLEGRADKNVMDVIIKDIKAKGRLKTELHPKSWTSPPTHKVQFFYEQIYITLQIPSRTPLPAYTQPTA